MRLHANGTTILAYTERTEELCRGHGVAFIFQGEILVMSGSETTYTKYDRYRRGN